jgi:hypothetical protein
VSERTRISDKFLPAKFVKGDYHENMDHHAFFKWQVSVFKTYKMWCLELQSILDRKRELNVPLPERLSEFDFYDRANGRPTRSLDMYMDNAPYHAFGSSHITNMTKEEIAAHLVNNALSLEVLSTLFLVPLKNGSLQNPLLQNCRRRSLNYSLRKSATSIFLSLLK